MHGRLRRRDRRAYLMDSESPEEFAVRSPVRILGVARAGWLADRFRPDAAPRQRLAQQELDLGVGTAQVGGREALDLGPQLRVDAQQEGLLVGACHRWPQLAAASARSSAVLS